MRRAAKSYESCPARQRGITIIEIMVTLAIAAVLIGLAVPAFNAFVAQRTLTAQVNDFLVSVQYARSEAGRRGTVVSVLARDASNGANEWGRGWCVVVDNPVTAACADDGTDLRSYASLGNNTLNGIGQFNTVSRLTFNSRGMLLAPAGGGALDPCAPAAVDVLNLCNSNQDVGRRVSLTAIGRVANCEPSVAILDCKP
jgi:type IV fimbrial biogenesis protein FimT